LKLIVESEQAVVIGAPLLEIGNPSNLEIVVELLSADAVKVKEGAKATIEGWGGPPLNAHVSTIEPSGFTKVSALGIEEQRVKTILVLDDPPETWRRLGHDYRVFAKINVYEAANALLVPLGALFRKGDSWSVFVLQDGRAVSKHLKIGQRNNSHAEVLEGIKEGERAILHPSDRILDGARVRARDNGP
jgi:HlyD family secretion protein